MRTKKTARKRARQVERFNIMAYRTTLNRNKLFWNHEQDRRDKKWSQRINAAYATGS